MKERKNSSKKKERVFNPEIMLKNKCIPSLQKVCDYVKHFKGLGLKIILTMGSWDLVHIGHARYFREAKKYGDILIVGVDSDEKVRARKGHGRPIVPQNERMEMVTHFRYVDMAVLKELSVPKWQMIKMIKPDVLIATKETYSQKEIKELKKYCGEVVVLEPQATTSTSAKIRRLQMTTAKKLEKILVPKLLTSIKESLDEVRS
ncbi:MAG: adenylyltransferase/cytidyltransferase family protein [Patescibacteria group bacterium]